MTPGTTVVVALELAAAVIVPSKNAIAAVVLNFMPCFLLVLDRLSYDAFTRHWIPVAAEWTYRLSP